MLWCIRGFWQDSQISVPFSCGFFMQYTEVLTDKDFDECYPYIRETVAFEE